ncbi:MAG: hypothetical protein ACJ77B_04050 [Chloroflexota bacterium]
MPALEAMPGIRVVADPAALDAARWTGDEPTVLRIAPDEALGLGATGVDVDDPAAIVVAEAGFLGGWVDAGGLADVQAHTDWPLPEEPGTVAQGKIAGVPAKLLVGDRPLLVTHAAYADELLDRLRWRRP